MPTLVLFLWFYHGDRGWFVCAGVWQGWGLLPFKLGGGSHGVRQPADLVRCRIPAFLQGHPESQPLRRVLCLAFTQFAARYLPGEDVLPLAGLVGDKIKKALQ